LTRELREELNVEITPPAGEPLLRRQDTELLLDVWKVDDWNGDIVNTAPDEHDGFGWFSLDETLALDLADDDYPALFKRVLR
jgi:8-oxo-dGTP diphosphatase